VGLDLVAQAGGLSTVAVRARPQEKGTKRVRLGRIGIGVGRGLMTDVELRVDLHPVGEGLGHRQSGRYPSCQARFSHGGCSAFALALSLICIRTDAALPLLRNDRRMKMENSDYDKALQSVDQMGRSAEALKLLSDASEVDIRAKYAVATWYLHGVEGVVKENKKMAFQILSELEKFNIAEALFDLAVFYDLGVNVEKNEIKAFELYIRAALLGDAESCIQLAQFFREGKLVPYSEPVAGAWEERALAPMSRASFPSRIWLR